MKFVILLVLAALWAVVLVPPLLRARTGRSNDSIGDFNYRLGVLSRTGRRSGRRSRSLPVLSPVSIPGRLPPIPSRALAPQRAAKRRRDITLGLLTAAAVTLLFAVLAHREALWALHGLIDVLVVSYLGLCAWFRSTQAVPARPGRVEQPLPAVHYLPPRAPAPELLRQTASS